MGTRVHVVQAVVIDEDDIDSTPPSGLSGSGHRLGGQHGRAEGVAQVRLDQAAIVAERGVERRGAGYSLQDRTHHPVQSLGLCAALVQGGCCGSFRACLTSGFFA